MATKKKKHVSVDLGDDYFQHVEKEESYLQKV